MNSSNRKAANQRSPFKPMATDFHSKQRSFLINQGSIEINFLFFLSSMLGTFLEAFSTMVRSVDSIETKIN